VCGVDCHKEGRRIKPGERPDRSRGSKYLYRGQRGYLINEQCPLVEGAALLSARCLSHHIGGMHEYPTSIVILTVYSHTAHLTAAIYTPQPT